MTGIGREAALPLPRRSLRFQRLARWLSSAERVEAQNYS
jgi:hypothetical protein